MKEVKIVQLAELVNPEADYWYRSPHRPPRERSRKERQLVEQELAELLNDGWQIEGISGESLSQGFIVLVRER